MHEQLGRGAMGRVYRVTTRDGGEEFAAKILREDLASDSDLVARFMQERSIMLSLDDPALVRVHDLVVEGDTVAIVMDLVRGPNLRVHLDREHTLAPEEAASLVASTLGGLAALHAAGVVHRDIKPENVLVEPGPDGKPTARLADFGIARIVEGPRLTRTTGMMGTVDYMAPELIEGEDGTPAVDVYSTGVMLYELLGGSAPFSGGPAAAVLQRHVNDEPEPLAGLPAPLWAVLEPMLAKDPSARPDPVAAQASLESLAGQLTGVAALPPREHATSSVKRTPRRASGATTGGGSTGATPASPSGLPVGPLGPDDSGLLTVMPKSRHEPDGRPQQSEKAASRRRRLVIGLIGAVAAAALVLGLLLTSGSNHAVVVGDRGISTTTGRAGGTATTTRSSTKGSTSGGSSRTAGGVSGSSKGSRGAGGGGGTGSQATTLSGAGGNSVSTSSPGGDGSGGSDQGGSGTSPTGGGGSGGGGGAGGGGSPTTTRATTATTTRTTTPATTTTTAPPPPSPITISDTGVTGGSGSFTASGKGNVNYGASDACADQGSFSSGSYPPKDCAQVGTPYASPTDQFWFTGNGNCSSEGHPYSGSTFTWTVQIPRTGRWTVSIFIPYWTNYNLGAVYDWNYAGGSGNNHVNQQAHAGHWLGITTQTMDAGGSYQLVLTTADTYDGYCHYQPADKAMWTWAGS